MTNRSFLDTNVLVYAFDSGPAVAAKRRRALDILRTAGPGDLVVSTQVLAEFYVVVTRKLPMPLADNDAAQAVERLASLPVVQTDAALVLAAVATSQSSHISLGDALIVEAARTGGCSRILTEDLSGGAAIGGLQIVDPFDGDQP